MELPSACAQRSASRPDKYFLGILRPRPRPVVLAASEIKVQAAITPPPLRPSVPGDNPYDASRRRQVQLVWQSSSEEQFRRLAQERAAARTLMIDIKCCQTWQHLARLHMRNAANMNHLHISATVTHLAQLLTRPNDNQASAQFSASQWSDHSSSDSHSQQADSHRSSKHKQDIEHHGGESRTGLLEPKFSSTADLSGIPGLAGSTLQPLLVSDSRGLLSESTGRGLSGTGPVAAEPLLSRPPDITTISSFMPQLLETVMTHLPAYEGRQIANTLWALSKIHALGVYTPPRSVVIRLLQETTSPAPPSINPSTPRSSHRQSTQAATTPSTPPAPSSWSSQARQTETMPGSGVAERSSGTSPQAAQQAFNPGRISDGLERERSAGASSLHDWVSQARSDAGLPSAVLLGSLHNQISLPSVMLGSASGSNGGASSAYQDPPPSRETPEQLPSSFTQRSSSAPPPSSPPLPSQSSSRDQLPTHRLEASVHPTSTRTGLAQDAWRQPQTASHSEQHSVTGSSSSSSSSRAAQAGTTSMQSEASSSPAGKLSGFESQHLANTLYAIGTMGVIPPAHWMEACIKQVLHELPSFKPQEVSNTLYSLALIQQSCKSRSIIDPESLQTLLQAAEHYFHRLKLQELLNILWAASRLGTLSRARRGEDRSNSSSGQSLTRVVTIGRTLVQRQARAGTATAPLLAPQAADKQATSSVPSSAEQASSSPPSSPKMAAAALAGSVSMPATPAHPPPPPWTTHLCEVAFPLLTQDRISHPFQTHPTPTPPLTRTSHPDSGFVQQAREFSRTGQTRGSDQGFQSHSSTNNHRSATHSSRLHNPATAAAYSSSSPPSSHVQPEHRSVPFFATTVLISSLGRLRFRPAIHSLHRLLAALPPLETLDPQALSDLLTGLVHMAYAPHPVWIRNAGRAVLSCLGRCSAQNLVMLLWALSHYDGSLDRSFFTPYLYSMNRVMGDLKSTEVALLVNSLARVRVRPGAIWMERFCIEAAQHLPRMDPQSHAIMMCALATLNHKPSALWMSAVEAATLPALSNQHSTAGLSQLLYGFAVLGYRPHQEWREALQETLQLYLPDLRPQDFASLLWSLAMLDVRPPVRLLTTLLSSLEKQTRNMSSPSVTQTLWALARWQPLPDGPWQALIASLHRQQRESDSQQKQAELAGAAGVAARRARRQNISAVTAAQTAARRSYLFVSDSEENSLGLSEQQVSMEQLQMVQRVVDAGVSVESAVVESELSDVQRRREDYDKVVLEGLVAWASGRVKVAVGASLPVR